MSAPSRPRSCLARWQRRPVDVEAEKREGWRRHGILVVRADDPNLAWTERELVRRLGERLYGGPPGGDG